MFPSQLALSDRRRPRNFPNRETDKFLPHTSPNYRGTVMALIIIIITCALALGIDFIVER